MTVRARVAALEAVDTATVLRCGVLGLVAFGLAGTTVELVFLRHWSTATEAVVWPVMLALAVAFAAIVWRPSPRVVRVARVVALIAAVFALIGIGFHVAENLTAGPLDRAYAVRWDSMPAIEQWFDAVTGAVGPAPTLAPGVLGEMGLALLLSTVRHPALAADSS